MNVFAKTSLAMVGAMALLSLAPLAASAQEMAYPEKCKAEGMDTTKMGASMGGHMKMGDMPTGEMTDYQKAAMDGMKSMHMNMMQGMMKKDADVSFVCGMIAHHIGAISMSEAELKYGENKEAKAMARKVIEAQKKEIAQMTKWVNKEAK
ncbi:DUF305 domain-containing protein [Rhizobium sp. N122]|uniref:CopM family metallochaperone n=1 Tax=Rhizobium sp. N122 TaxID=1764272 RepID=UPI000B5A6D7D|nr:DUF305 domain-containing protein [Rhizobium sp. N122]OWV87877.1 DUF305 domain-containing protein [Rhizobium sp. N122]